MIKKTRTILFFICLVLFLAVTPLIVLYSQGYRFDFDSKKIVQTGGFYLKVRPKSVRIYLDGKLKKKTDFLFGSVLIENLLPKKYQIQIKKAGFHTWEKTLQIYEKRVTELKNIFLVPQKLALNEVVKNIDHFWPSPDGKSIILKEMSENDWVLKILELENGLKTHLFNEEDFREEKDTEAQISDLKFSPDSGKILLKIKEEEEKKYFIFEIEKEILTDLTSLNFLREDIKKISLNSREQQEIFFSTGNGLFEYNFLNKEMNQILEDLVTYETSDGNIYFISRDGFLLRTDFSARTQEKLNFEPFTLKDDAKYQILLKEENIFVLEDDTVYFWDKDSKRLEKLFEGMKSFEISPDYKKIVFSSDHEIWILFLEETTEQPPKKAGEKLFLTRFSEKIDKIFWWTSHYLIFNVESKIKIAEIDDRDRINIVDLLTVHTQVEFKEPEIFFNKVDKKLYILDEGNLFISEKLLP